MAQSKSNPIVRGNLPKIEGLDSTNTSANGFAVFLLGKKQKTLSGAEFMDLYSVNKVGESREGFTGTRQALIVTDAQGNQVPFTLPENYLTMPGLAYDKNKNAWWYANTIENLYRGYMTNITDLVYSKQKLGSPEFLATQNNYTDAKGEKGNGSSAKKTPISKGTGKDLFRREGEGEKRGVRKKGSKSQLIGALGWSWGFLQIIPWVYLPKKGNGTNENDDNVSNFPKYVLILIGIILFLKMRKRRVARRTARRTSRRVARRVSNRKINRNLPTQ
jgi:hypothetical protein